MRCAGNTTSEVWAQVAKRERLGVVSARKAMPYHTTQRRRGLRWRNHLANLSGEGENVVDLNVASNLRKYSESRESSSALETPRNQNLPRNQNYHLIRYF